MKRKIIWFTATIVCFGLACLLMCILAKFFTEGGGLIKVKGLLAPGVLFGLGLYSLYRLMSEFGLSKTLSILSVALILAAGTGSIVYLNSWSYRQKIILRDIRNGSLSETEAIRLVKELINEHSESTDKTARECVDIMIQRNSPWALYQKGSWSSQEGHYSEAFQYMKKAEKSLTPGDNVNLDIYEALANAYYEGEGTTINKNLALEYYIKAYKSSSPQFEGDLERIMRIADELNYDMSNVDLRYRCSALESFYDD